MRKLLLILCLAFLGVCFAYPCFMLPIGAYKCENEVLGQKVEVEYRFAFSGKATVKVGENETEYNYKLKGNKIILSEDEEFDDSDLEIEMNSFYELDGTLDSLGKDMVNSIAMWITIGVGALSLLLIVLPSRK